MTDQIDQNTDTDAEGIDTEAPVRNKRRMFIAGAGLAGAAAIVGTSGTASAADDDEVLVGNPDNETDDGATVITNTNNTSTTPGTPGQEAVFGVLTGADNGSHAVRGLTAGIGHAIAGNVTADNANNSVAATWGKHDNGLGAGVGGVNGATDVDIAGPARGVEGIVIEDSNGSHAVFGLTNGGGHSVAGDTPADAAGPGGVGPNTTAATWGRHGGVGAGIGGVSAGGYGGEFIGGKAHVRLITDIDDEGNDLPAGAPTDDGHLRGEIYADGVGDLWYNTADGSNWVPLTKGGNVLFIDPARAYDTRPGSTPPNTDKTQFDAGETREVDLSTLVPDFPATATAAIINLTVVNTDGRGFATVFNGDTADGDRPNTSNINWDVATGVIANSATVRANADGVIKVYTSQATDVIIDVQGYIA